MPHVQVKAIMWREQDHIVTKHDKQQSKHMKTGNGDRFFNKAKDKLKQNHNNRKGLNGEATPEELWNKFAKEQLTLVPEMNYEAICYGNRVYLQPEGIPSLAGLKVVRAGWYIGELKNGRFVPSHPLAMGIRINLCRSLSGRVW